jgi:peptidoglycan/xylan/chitin deacetylase (PgdA/CDA1 family)
MWRRLVAAVALAVVLAGLAAAQTTPAQAATYYNSRCGNTSGRVLNHTYSHPNLTQLSDAGVSSQIRNGITSNRLRPPYGAYDSRVSSIASSLGYRICTWTIDTRDWEYVNGSRRSTSSIRSIVRNSPWSAKASGVVLGHLNTNYPDAMSGIISDLHSQGLLFCRNRGPVGRNMPFPASCT